MKIIHTSDWHLGQNFFDQNRLTEQKIFLDYLLDIIEIEKVEAIIVSGDIFDTSNPPKEAEKLYYDFLLNCSRLNDEKTQVIIIGGNHDSPAHLDAPRHLLQSLNINVIGAYDSDYERLLIPLGTDKQNPEAWVAAIPFLRDRDVRKAVSGETFGDVQERTRQGIIKCYNSIAKEVQSIIKDHTNIPIIGTGHLSLLGSSPSDSERTVHIGNLGSISAQQFPNCFDYYALGHLHSPQKVGDNDNIRYSGSPIPLSFSETKAKQLRLITIEGEKLTHTKIDIPVFRRLIRLRGNQEEILAKLTTLNIQKNELSPWLEITMKQTQISPLEQDEFKEIAIKHGALVLKIILDIPQKVNTSQDDISLDKISPLEVFKYRLDTYNFEKEDASDKFNDLIDCFNMTLEAINEDL